MLQMIFDQNMGKKRWRVEIRLLRKGEGDVGVGESSTWRAFGWNVIDV
jgi:hypothetical protein